jgi:four helix bundle protein
VVSSQQSAVRSQQSVVSAQQSGVRSQQEAFGMKDFRTLNVWNKAHDLTVDLYKLTKSFPKEETYGLTSQIRKASASVGANIAEGCGKSSNADFARYLQIAFGSACELEYHLLLARDLKMVLTEDHHRFEFRLQDVKRMLASLISKVRSEIA